MGVPLDLEHGNTNAGIYIRIQNIINRDEVNVVLSDQSKVNPFIEVHKHTKTDKYELVYKTEVKLSRFIIILQFSSNVNDRELLVIYRWQTEKILWNGDH